MQSSQPRTVHGCGGDTAGPAPAAGAATAHRQARYATLIEGAKAGPYHTGGNPHLSTRRPPHERCNRVSNKICKKVNGSLYGRTTR
jgi:hypothetical protein